MKSAVEPVVPSVLHEKKAAIWITKFFKLGKLAEMSMPMRLQIGWNPKMGTASTIK